MTNLSKPLILFSTNTYLAYRINRDYYGDKHFIYCTSKAGCKSLTVELLDNPSSSSPMTRYKQLKEGSKTGELHGIIKEQKLGIQKGALEKYKKGLITLEQKNEIFYIAEEARNLDYRPLLYIIPYNKIKELLKEVKIQDKASLFSEEYIIEELPGDSFVIIEF